MDIADGGTAIFGARVGTEVSLTFIIKNTNLGNLTGLGITIEGSDAALFAVTSSPTAPVGPVLGSTNFTVRYAPATAGLKSANLKIANNDDDENPFDINLSGRDLVFTEDSDGDGLSDAAEFDLAALGFDWQVSQVDLVDALFNNANGAGLYTRTQVQALHVGTPLLERDPVSGFFTLTIGVEKSADLMDFSPFPMTGPQTSINGQGNLEFEFSVADEAAFFRVESNLGERRGGLPWLGLPRDSL
jgi:hypothetical protein